MTLPADSHVHTEWSWDAPAGSMRRTCERAREIGLRTLAFTEHVDHTTWQVSLEDLPDGDHLLSLVDGETLTPPPFDVAGYLAEVEECRERYPDLRILTGLELGEPHWHRDAVARVLAAGSFDRVLGSLHSLPLEEGYAEPPGLFRQRAADAVVRDYLAEVAVLVAGDDPFDVLAHIDYPLRHWPADAGPLDLTVFEDELRHALRTTAASGRALEVNTRLPLSPLVLRWWHEEGGDAVSFGSDAHAPDRIARGFRDAAQLAEACGFRPGRDHADLWGRA